MSHEDLPPDTPMENIFAIFVAFLVGVILAPLLLIRSLFDDDGPAWEGRWE